MFSTVKGYQIETAISNETESPVLIYIFHRRSGIEILAGKTIRKDADGFEDFRDYLSESGKI